MFDESGEGAFRWLIASCHRINEYRVRTVQLRHETNFLVNSTSSSAMLRWRSTYFMGRKRDREPKGGVSFLLVRLHYLSHECKENISKNQLLGFMGYAIRICCERRRNFPGKSGFIGGDLTLRGVPPPIPFIVAHVMRLESSSSERIRLQHVPGIWKEGALRLLLIESALNFDSLTSLLGKRVCFISWKVFSAFFPILVSGLLGRKNYLLERMQKKPSCMQITKEARNGFWTFLCSESRRQLPTSFLRNSVSFINSTYK